MRVGPKLKNQHRREKQNSRREGESQYVGDFVTMTEAMNKSTRPSLRRGRVLNRGCGGCHFVWLDYLIVARAFSSLSTTGLGSFA